MVKWLKEPKISRLALIMVVSSILYFVFMETEIFEDTGDIVKVVFYASIMLATAMLGVSIVNMKKFATKVSDIYYNMKLALIILDKISDIFEENQGLIPISKEEREVKA